MRMIQALLPISFLGGCSDEPVIYSPPLLRDTCSSLYCTLPVSEFVDNSVTLSPRPPVILFANTPPAQSRTEKCQWQEGGFDCGSYFLETSGAPGNGLALRYPSGSNTALFSYVNKDTMLEVFANINLPRVHVFDHGDTDARLRVLPTINDIALKVASHEMVEFDAWSIETGIESSASTDPRKYYMDKLIAAGDAISRYPVGIVKLPGTSTENKYSILSYRIIKDDGTQSFFHVAVDGDGKVVTVFPFGKLFLVTKSGKKTELGSVTELDLSEKNQKNYRLEFNLPNGAYVYVVQPHDTIAYNNTFLELFMHKESGHELFPEKIQDGIRIFKIMPTDQGYDYDYGAMYVDYNKEIEIASGRDHNTLMHELIHHWGITVNKAYLKTQGVADAFYRLNWSLNYDHVYFPEGLTGKDDWNDFIPWEEDWERKDRRPYGRRNGTEDMATFGAWYYIDGSDLRVWVRDQMKKGNFEPALKYLYFKAFPFEGREYFSSTQESVDSHNTASLSYQEVERTLALLDEGGLSSGAGRSFAVIKKKLVEIEEAQELFRQLHRPGDIDLRFISGKKKDDEKKIPDGSYTKKLREQKSREKRRTPFGF